MKFAKYSFLSAAMYGFLSLVPLFFYEQKLGIDYPPAVTHAEYYYSFISITLVWQILFVFIGLNPVKYRPVMLFCCLEKLALLPTAFILFPQGRFPMLWIPLVIIDLGFCTAFFSAYRKTKSASTSF